MSTGDFRVADISLADFGRKEIEIAEHEVINNCDKQSATLFQINFANQPLATKPIIPKCNLVSTPSRPL